MLLEEGRHVVVPDLDRAHGHRRRVEPGRDMAAEAVEHGLGVDLAAAPERARKEGVHGHKLHRGMDFDVALAELGIEALERMDAFLGELDPALADTLLQPQRSVND